MIINLGNGIVNNYLIIRKDGHILIDTGYPNGFRHFQRQLKKAGIESKDIKYVFLTHAHDDHAGFLNDVLDITDAKVILHPKAVDGLKRGQNSFKGGCSGRLAYLFCLILALFGKGAHKYPAIREEFLDRLITTDSETFQRMELPFQVIETPGHTRDHISLIMDGKLFCGDAAMNGFPSVHHVIIWIEDLEQYKQSWKRILKYSPKKIFVGHGRPFHTADLKKNLRRLDHIRLYPLKQR